MTCFAVMREAGPSWLPGGIAGQPAVGEHAAFMSALEAQGVVLLAGPLARSEDGRIRVLLIVDAESVVEIHRLLADDPWQRGRQLVTARVEPWRVVVGAARLLPGKA
jgi:uncharacterized protein YciI